MDKYRVKLKAQLRLYAVGLAALMATEILAFSRKLRPVAAGANWPDAWNGFIAGAAMALTAALALGVILNARALRSERALKRLYRRENDERAAHIAVAARSAGAQSFLLMGIVAGVIAGWFSVTVSLTIIGCVAANGLLCVGFKLYYLRKF